MLPSSLMMAGARTNPEPYPRNLDPEPERRPPCSECGELIAAGTGRYNVGKNRYHVECYDVTRHMMLTSPAPLLIGQPSIFSSWT